jgi:histidinol-phosphatase (PHP family)
MLFGEKLMFDSHVHVDFSTDSRMSIEEAIKKSKEDNIGLIITDHMDINYPDSKKFRFNPEEYFLKFEKYRNESLLLGIELGMTIDFMEENRKLVTGYPFDYVIGSLHFLGNNDIYDAITYEGKSKVEVYTQYFSDMLENLRVHDYIDSLGHLDYICRYNPYEDKEIYYNEFSNLIDEVLKFIIDREIYLELNTRRISNKRSLELFLPILDRYEELGGKYITLGSDAHDAITIGANFKTAFEAIEKSDLKVVYFKERKPYILLR